jgi:hypothetical protein
MVEHDGLVATRDDFLADVPTDEPVTPGNANLHGSFSALFDAMVDASAPPVTDVE